MPKCQHKCFVQNWDTAETNSWFGSSQITATKWVNTIESTELEKTQLKNICCIIYHMTIVDCMLCNIPLSFEMIENRNIGDYIELQKGEQWRPVVQCPEHYSVSSFGRIFSWKSKFQYNYKPIGLLKTGKHSLGYCVVSLDYQAPTKLHRVVALAFIPNPDNKPEVNHIDHNKQNNRVDNLEWVTHSENIQASYTGGFRVSKRGDKHHRYGKTIPESARSAMSEAKMGENHPKFKGWYIIDETKYSSANQAAKALGIHPIMVSRRAVDDRFPNWEFVPKEDKTPILDA
jgi:hypothetical protein